jgi:hypothetical protein
MANLIASPRRAFWRSPHHAAMALFTVGAGFATGEPLYFVLGATAYVLGWVYLPDMAFFRNWVDRRASAHTDAAAATELQQFARRREALLSSLSSQLRERYQTLAIVCRDIERATAESEHISERDLASDTRLRKIDELMWMYLRLLSIQQSVETFLETERREDLHGSLLVAEEEVGALRNEVEALKQANGGSEAKERLLSSRLDRLDVLRKRLERVQEAEANLELVISEQERLSEQIKLIRADAVATKNADALSARINASVAHLNETNKWLSQMDQFRDLAGDLPMTDSRLGFEAKGIVRGSTPPPLPASTPARQQRGRERA